MKKKELIKLNKKMKMVNTSSDENEVKTFIILVVIIILAIGIIYGCTELLNKKKTKDTTETKETGTINYDRLAVGTLLNRPYDDYYVLVYDSKGEEATTYSTILSNYMAKKDEKGYIKIYYCDLNNSINKAYYNVNNDNKSNPKAEKIEDLDFGNITLIRVKKGKITSYIEKVDKIKEELK